MTTWSEGRYRKFKQDEARDWARTQQADQEAADSRQMETEMSTRKTKFGDRVEKFPDVSDRADRIAEVRQKLADAFDEAEGALNRKKRMAATATNQPDRRRFSALKGSN